MNRQLDAEFCTICGAVSLESGHAMGYIDPQEFEQATREITFADLLIDCVTPHDGPCYTESCWLVSRRSETVYIGKVRA